MAAALLAPNGRLAILDMLADDERSPLTTALYALSLLGRTDGGGTYTAADYTRWLTAAGCRSIERILLADSAVTLVLAHRA